MKQQDCAHPLVPVLPERPEAACPSGWGQPLAGLPAVKRHRHLYTRTRRHQHGKHTQLYAGAVRPQQQLTNSGSSHVDMMQPSCGIFSSPPLLSCTAIIPSSIVAWEANLATMPAAQPGWSWRPASSPGCCWRWEQLGLAQAPCERLAQIGLLNHLYSDLLRRRHLQKRPI